MARTVDPEKHLARRLLIIDAALTRFAADGYERTTTAAICRQAGIGSGTFFHYFPTKQSVLVAILELGTAETAAWFAAQDDASSPRAVLDAYVRHAVAELADPRIAGFVRAVGAVMAVPEIEAALARDARTLQEGLEPWTARAQQAGQVRTDLSARDLTAWLLLVLDGFLGRLATDDEFTAAAQGSVLEDVVARLLSPPVVEQRGRRPVVEQRGRRQVVE